MRRAREADAGLYVGVADFLIGPDVGVEQLGECGVVAGDPAGAVVVDLIDEAQIGEALADAGQGIEEPVCAVGEVEAARREAFDEVGEEGLGLVEGEEVVGGVDEGRDGAKAVGGGAEVVVVGVGGDDDEADARGEGADHVEGDALGAAHGEEGQEDDDGGARIGREGHAEEAMHRRAMRQRRRLRFALGEEEAIVFEQQRSRRRLAAQRQL